MGNPTVRVAVNGNILKHYQNSSVYLSTDTEFQLELNNPTSDELKAVLSINGREESTGLILKPGQRIFLKRFLDEDKKFVFSTYEIPSENKGAVASNGEIRVSFFKEFRYVPPVQDSVIYPPYYHKKNPFYVSDFFYSTSAGTAPKSITRAVNGGTLTTANLDIKNISFTNSSDVFAQQDFSDQQGFAQAEQMETGRVEAGERSGQEFTTVYDGKSWVRHSVSVVKILPLSQKPPEVQVRQYCPHCGAKVKPEWKFCPSCGKSIWE